MMWFLYLLTLLIGLLGAFYWYVKVQFSFWANRGVPFKKPHWILGNFEDYTRRKSSSTEVTTALYNEFKSEKFVGAWHFYKPILFIIDTSLLRQIMTRDFEIWSSRGIALDEEVDPLTAHLIYLTGHKWKTVRQKLTPAFTSKKLKQMHELLLECCKEFAKHLDAIVVADCPVNAKEMSAEFVMDVIGSCVFGIQMNGVSKENMLFRKMAEKICQISLREIVMRRLHATFPRLYNLLNIPLWDEDLTAFFFRIMKEAFEYREKNNVRRNDFVDLLKDLKNTGEPLAEGEIEFDDKLLTAQALIFFAAGFETSSTAMSYCLHELAVNQDFQDRLREEFIETTAAAKGDEITWDGVKSMKYLDMVLKETLRKHPPIPVSMRACVKPYRIPDADVELPAGTVSFIPIYALHHDPEYFPDPEKFDPERFTEEATKQRRPFTYLPFGDGPRHCIASRFAEQQTKLGIFTVIKNFKVSLCEKSQNPLQHDPEARFLASKNGIWLRLSRYSEC